MFYLTSKCHDNNVDIFGFIEKGVGGGGGELLKPRRNRVKTKIYLFFYIFPIKVQQILTWNTSYNN